MADAAVVAGPGTGRLRLTLPVAPGVGIGGPLAAGGRGRGGLGDRLGLLVEAGVARPEVVEGGVGGVLRGLTGLPRGHLAEHVPRLLGQLTQGLGHVDVVPRGVHAVQVGVEEVVHAPDVTGGGAGDALQPERLTQRVDRPGPVVEQVVVAQEETPVAPGGPLRVEHVVDPAGHPAALGDVGGVVVLLAADHLGGRPERDRVGLLDAGAQSGSPPETEEPREPGVLDHQLVDTGLGELGVEPGHQLLADGLVGAQLGGVQPGLGAGVGDADVAAAQQPVVEVDDPLRLGEALGVGVVGRDLGERDLETELLEGPCKCTRTTATRAHDQHCASWGRCRRRGGGGDVTQGSAFP